MSARQWKDVAGLEGRYQVSDDGYVRSLPDIDVRGQFMPGRILRHAVTEKGYARVNLAGRDFKVHRLVAAAFLPNPDALPEVNHLDGDKLRNRVDNIEWSTSANNHLHRYAVLGHTSGMAGKQGIACANSKPVAGRSVATGKHIGFFGSAAEAARMTGASGSAISLVARGLAQSHKGVHWVFVTREQYEEAST